LEERPSPLEGKGPGSSAASPDPTQQPVSAAELARLRKAQEAIGRMPELPVLPEEIPPVPEAVPPLPQLDPKILGDTADAGKALDKLKDLVGNRKT
jgi:hypothetical protein